MHRVSIASPTFEYDPEDPEGFRAGMFRIGTQVGAKETGTSVYELPPGQALCPYHYEYGEEEWLLVVSGDVTVRHPGGTDVLGPMEATCFVRGPEGAHQVRNDSDATVRLIMWSTVVHPTATAYPDSGKVGISTGVEGEDVMARRADSVPYYDGETAPGAGPAA